MGYKKNKEQLSTYFIKELSKKIAYGSSRHDDKEQEKNKNLERGMITKDKIYSHNTYKTYEQQLNNFASWCEKNNITSPKGARENCKEWVNESGKSIKTMQTRAAALTKIWGGENKDYSNYELRFSREQITRGRDGNAKTMKIHTEKTDLWTANCGFRRGELINCRVEDFKRNEEGQCVSVHIKGKGGKERDAIILDRDVITRAVDDLISSSNGENVKVCPTLSHSINNHYVRHEYIKNLYEYIARPIEELDENRRILCPYKKNGKDVYKSEVYETRKLENNQVYDRQALFVASAELGHNREDVVVNNYLSTY